MIVSLAFMIASDSEHLPSPMLMSALVVFTVIVAACTPWPNARSNAAPANDHASLCCRARPSGRCIRSLAMCVSSRERASLRCNARRVCLGKARSCT